MIMKGLQEGPDLVPAMFDVPRKKPKLLAIIVLLLAATGAAAAIQDGPDGVDPLGSYVLELGFASESADSSDPNGTCSPYEAGACMDSCQTANSNAEHCMAWMRSCDPQPGGWVKCACGYFCANDPWGGARRPDDGGATWPELATDECQPWDDVR